MRLRTFVDKVGLISLITSDIELLEVYYAHTVSPIAIAALTTIVMVSFNAEKLTKLSPRS